MFGMEPQTERSVNGVPVHRPVTSNAMESCLVQEDLENPSRGRDPMFGLVMPSELRAGLAPGAAVGALRDHQRAGGRDVTMSVDLYRVYPPRRPLRPSRSCYAPDVVWRWERLANCGEPVQARPGSASRLRPATPRHNGGALAE